MSGRLISKWIALIATVSLATNKMMNLSMFSTMMYSTKVSKELVSNIRYSGVCTTYSVLGLYALWYEMQAWTYAYANGWLLLIVWELYLPIVMENAGLAYYIATYITIMKYVVIVSSMKFYVCLAIENITKKYTRQYAAEIEAMHEN